MKHASSDIQSALKIINQRRQKAIDEFDKNREEAYKTIPMLYQIDDELMSSGSSISNAVFGKKQDIKNEIEKIKEKNKRLIDEKKRLLTENGFSADFLKIPYFCNKCNDTGFVDAMPCTCLEDVIESQKKESDKMSKEDADFKNFDLNYYPQSIGKIKCREIMESIYNNCIEYSNNFSLGSPNLFIFGGTGIGKTHIAVSIAKNILSKGFKVKYISAPDLFTMLEKERFQQEQTDESIEKIVKYDLLVIDDLGCEFTTGFTVSALYNIVNTRLLNELPTIITANLLPSEISQRYTERIASRIIGCYEHLHFIGNDIRILKKKEQ